MTWKQQLKSRAAKGLAAATAVLTVFSLLPSLALAAAGDSSFTEDTTITLSDNDITLTIQSGSTADTVLVGSSSVTVTTGATDTFTISAPDSNKMNNDSNYAVCNRVDGEPTIEITGAAVVVITPSTSLCSSGSSGGGGGGGGGSSGSSTTTPSITVTAPVSGNSLEGGSDENIKWSKGGSGISYLNLYYTFDGGDSYATIATHVSVGDGKYAWSVPNIDESEVVIRAIAYDSGAAKLAQDDSGTFSISLNGTIAEETPTTSTSTSSEVLTRDEANTALPSGVAVDGLVKLPDDGDPSTQNDTAVYYVGLDAKRHPFPNSQMYFTWFEDFSGVKEISATDMASIKMGKPIMTRPGTLMVKIQTDPKVYAVSPGYVLHWVSTESVAKDLYGDDWNTKIMDVEDTYFAKFSFGTDLEDGEAHPSGALVRVDATSSTYYIDGEKKRKITSGAAFDDNMFQSRFVQTSADGAWVGLTAGDDVTEFEDGLFSEQLFN